MTVDNVELDPEPYWVEEALNRYSRSEILEYDLLWNLAIFKPRAGYSQDEQDYR